MSEQFAVVETWPELFEGLTDEQHRAVVNALASGWHEGWTPNREDVGDLSDYVRGTITMEEYQARSLAKVQRLKNAATNAAG